MKRSFWAIAVFTLAAALLTTVPADAAPPWVDRGMTLERHVFAGDVGLGLGREPIRIRPFPYDDSTLGAGLNLEGAFGITEKVEVGLRTGVRFGVDGEVTNADYYGRTLWTETYGSYGSRYDSVANPEARVRWAAYQGDVVEFGLDGRLYLPIEGGSRFGTMFGLPLAFHLGRIARIDTGPYFPLHFYSPLNLFITVPGYVWFQVSERVWLGPMTSLRFRLAPEGGDRFGFLLGFGLGVQVHSAVDLKMWFLFPRIDEPEGARSWGTGFGVQFRIGE